LPECCGRLMNTTVHDTGDGWVASLECPRCDDIRDVVQWPFVEDAATAQDWIDLGFTLV